MSRIYTFVPVLLFLCFFTLKAFCGNKDSSTVITPKKVLIIPYEPRMHLSDSDHDISRDSEKSPMQIRAMIRNEIAADLNKKLSSSYQTHSLMQDLRPEAMQELKRIYGSIDYSYDTSFAILHPRPDSLAQKGKWNENKARKKALESRSASGDVKYMNVIVLDPALLASLNAQYGADLFVFLTQVEIKTTTKDCGDMQFRMYERDIKLHYAVFDKNGNQVMGDVTTVHFPSNSNEIYDIQKNFPMLGDQITYAISIR